MTTPSSGSTERLRRVLGDPDLRRLIDRLARRLELDRALDGIVTLDDATPAERQAIARLLGRSPGRGASVSIPLPVLEGVLNRAGLATDLRGAIEAVAGPVAGRADLRTAEAERREAALTATARSRHAGEEWYAAWLDEISGDGTITRLIRRGDETMLDQVVAVLDELSDAVAAGVALPANDSDHALAMPLPVLAERATGNTKALSGTPLAGLVLRALAHWQSVPVPSTTQDERAVWEAAGVIVDDLASQVLVLNLRAVGAGLPTWLSEAADLGVPFRITLHQLVAMPFVPEAEEIFVCENPAVLRVAAATLERACAALVCAEGQPSVACHRLLAAAANSGVQVRWRGDFDWTGLRTTTMAVSQYDAVPWRMSTADYETALAVGHSEPLRGSTADSPWEETLAVRMRQTGRAVMEERLIPKLLTDLRG